MTDMNNNIGNKPIYNTARTEQHLEKAPEPPICECPECEKTFSPDKTDLSKDPRALQGRSQVKKASVVEHNRGTDLAGDLAKIIGENGDILQEFQEQYYRAALEKGFSPEIAEEKSELALLALLGAVFED